MSFYIHPDVQAIRDLHADALDSASKSVSVFTFLELQAQTLLHAYQAGNRAVLPHLGCWYPEFIGKAHDDIMSEARRRQFSVANARLTIARECGFESWSLVEAFGSVLPKHTFERALGLMMAGDLINLRDAIENQPGLVFERSHYGHQSTLLHYLSANGVETHRQVTPYNAPAIAAFLIAAGAEVNAEANMYGGGSRPLGLLLSSAHPANAGVTEAVAEVLVTAGAKE